MKMTKKLFAFTMTITMVLSLIAVPVYAEEGSDSEGDIMLISTQVDDDSSCPINKFSDLDKSLWYHDGIHFCLDKKIMNGTGENEFTPDGTITRAMIVTMLYRLEGSPSVNGNNVFSDVVEGSYYENAVIWASQRGIVKGYSYDGIDSNQFGSDDNVTREQLAAIMYRYTDYKGYDKGAKVTVNFGAFSDTSDVSSYALEPIKWACGAGLINGIDGSLKPANSATRAQAASIFQRFINYTVEGGDITPPSAPDKEPTPGDSEEIPSIEPDKPEDDNQNPDNSSDVTPSVPKEPQSVTLNPSWKYAGYSKINSGAAVLYYAQNNRKNIVVGVNAGHGTAGGSSQKTYCHPDMTPKTTGGSTAQGAIMATAIAGGMSFPDGTPEYKVTLAVAKKLKDKLLAAGYDVLMVRDGDDVQLDNIARTVICNNMADCHISIHFDSDGLSYDKGCFYISTPDAIKNMEPVSYTWQKSDVLGKALISGLSESGLKLYGKGSMAIDLTQTSYSTVPSIDIELGNQKTVLSDAAYEKYAEGLFKGIVKFFE